MKHSNAGKDVLKTDAGKEVISKTKEQLDLSNILEKVIHHCTSQAVEKKKKFVPESVKKKTH